MRRDSYVEHLGFLSCVHKADNTHRTYYDHLTEHSLRDGALGQTKLRPNGVLRSSLGGGHCTLGWAPTPTTWAASGRLRTLKAIHAPLIATNTAPAGTVGGMAWGRSSARTPARRCTSKRVRTPTALRPTSAESQSARRQRPRARCPRTRARWTPLRSTLAGCSPGWWAARRSPPPCPPGQSAPQRARRR